MARQEGVDLGVAEGMLKGGKTIKISNTYNMKTTVDEEGLRTMNEQRDAKLSYDLGVR
jgi:hypothetical protein